MSEEENSSVVKSPPSNHQMLEQDTVQITIGNWVKEVDGKWVFDILCEDENNCIRLSNGMEYDTLVQNVKAQLRLPTTAQIKMSYQYPTWMEIDDGDGSTPQFISDDHEVGVFVDMRREVEEVNLFVTITQCTDRSATNQQKPLHANVTDQTCLGNEEDGDTTDSESMANETWVDFAMSETPLTCPTIKNGVGGSFRVEGPETIPKGGNGIVIREPEPVITLCSPPQHPPCKGKGKRVSFPSDEETDDEAAVPINVPPSHDNCGEGTNSRTVKRRLFSVTPPPSEGSQQQNETREGEDNLVEPVIEPQATPVNPPPPLNQWNRFQDALQDIFNDESSQNVLFGRDAPPVIDSGENDGLDAALDAVPYEGDNLFVGQVFKSKTDCKIKIAIHAINRKFHLKTKRSTPKYMVLICVAVDCPWRVYAAKVDGFESFQIRQLTLSYCCTVDARRNYHKLATTQVIGELIQARFIAIKRGPSPATIRKMMLDDFHVNISYWKSWRSREVGMELALGSMAGSYALMPAYMGLVETTNPGSICRLHKQENAEGSMVFKYAFIAFGASIKGYRFMRKVIVIDGTSLKGRYGGCLLSASAQDGNFQIFPLAFGVVDSENDDAWEWFLKQLKLFVGDSPNLVFVSDRHGSIYNAIGKVYPASCHASCTVHLWRNIKARFKSKRVASLMGAAARAFTVSEFNKRFLDIQRVSPGCAAYLVDIGFDHWTRAYFRGDRYNIMDSNIAESWNAVLTEAREYPLISMCEYIRTKLMTWFAIRRAKAVEHKGTLTPSVRSMVEENYESSTAFAVTGISEMEFQIQVPSGYFHTVNLLSGTCTCNKFQQLRIPCTHAIAAAGRANISTESIAAAYFAETWHSGYEERIFPVPSVGGTESGGTFSGDLLPPDVRRPPGRPRKQRILSTGEDKRQPLTGCRKCSRCGGEGHNKASCRRPI